jgi:hypothetical protein
MSIIEVYPDGRVVHVGVDRKDAELVAVDLNHGTIVIKEPGQLYWASMLNPRAYAAAEFNVRAIEEVLEPRGEIRRLRIATTTLLSWPVRADHNSRHNLMARLDRLAKEGSASV